MLLVNTDCLTKKEAKILKAQIEQQAKERRMLEADYEARLKADMVAMLEELDNKIMEEYIEHMEVDWHEVIQEKIHELN